MSDSKSYNKPLNRIFDESYNLDGKFKLNDKLSHVHKIRIHNDHMIKVNFNISDIRIIILAGVVPEIKVFKKCFRYLCSALNLIMDDTCTKIDITSNSYMNWHNVLKPIFRYILFGSKITTSNQTVLMWYIFIYLNSNEFNESSDIDDLHTSATLIHNISNKHNLITYISYKLSMFYYVTTELNKTKILKYMKLYVSWGYGDAMKMYKECHNLTQSDIQNYVRHGGNIEYIHTKIIKQLQLHHSPYMFELCIYGITNPLVLYHTRHRDNPSSDGDNKYFPLNNEYKQHIIYKFLNHTNTPPSFEAKLLLNKYAYNPNESPIDNYWDCNYNRYNTVSDYVEPSELTAINNIPPCDECKYCKKDYYEKELSHYYRNLKYYIYKTLYYIIPTDGIIDTIFAFV
jgi:hypothetical protein